MASQNAISIKLKDGKEISIPKYSVSKIVMPSVLFNKKYFRLVIDMRNFERSLEELKRKFGV